MTSTTEPTVRRLSPPNPSLSGGLLCATGFVLIGWPSLLAAALGIELVAAGFWSWGRAAEDRTEQLPRWAWLRRPASALWLAAGLHAVMRDRGLGVLASFPTLPGVIARVEALAVLWGALELMAALPLARPFSDRPGPLSATGPWLPVMLPAAGFLVLWRHAAHWTVVPEVRTAALVLLLVTACLAALRAFGLRPWTASLRWLAVADCALGGTLVALRVVPDESALLLWLGACGGHGLLLAGELGGAAPRRGPHPHRLWRLAAWTALASLSWPVLAALGFGPPGLANPVFALAAAAAVALAAWVSVRRLVEAPERRTMVRREAAVPLIQIGALATMAAGPVALVIAWWSGFEPRWTDSLASLTPALAGGWAAGLGPRREEAGLAPRLRVPGGWGRRAAQVAFHGVMGVERQLVRLLTRLALVVIAPARDLHTGDAQEFLLFLAGVAVLALVLPLLR
jgi:hypothetical protein